MGTYLSTPVTEKGEESGEALDCPVTPVSWGVVDMQGWRKSMEDAHVAQTNIPIPPHLLKNERRTREEKEEQGQDDEKQQEVEEETKETKAKVFGVFDGHGGPEVARFCQLYMVDVLTKQTPWLGESPVKEESGDSSAGAVGRALIAAFHALDRMIDDESWREVLMRLRTEKPRAGEQRITDGHQIPPPSEDYSAPVTSLPPPPPPPPPQAKRPESEADEKTKPIASNVEEKGEEETLAADTMTEAKAETPVKAEKPKPDDVKGANDEREESVEMKADTQDDTEGGDDDSNVAVGDEGAEELEELDDAENDEKTKGELTDEEVERKVAIVLDEVAAELNGTNAETGVLSLSLNSETKVETIETSATVPTDAASTGPAFAATIIQNGRQICNLPDHPIHAGCTAVVAVLLEKSLTVANAGDSRAVLCAAGGRAEPLSFDHKPQQDRELSRITKAGGFVNQFGRVNANLNLSRSIGDLKYKQVPGLSPAEQMITAEPDILQVTLDSKDEFIIIGCDGIWDCLTNEQAVKFVRDRIDTNTPIEIGKEMLDEILSDDPRASQGIGGDNMTVMIIDLQPDTRSYR